MDDVAIFLAVFRGQGFRAAAKTLGLAPSTVSERITALEVTLGVPLFIRTTRSVTPTEAGRMLAKRMAPLLSEMRSVMNDVASSQREVRGLLRLNVTGAVMVDILPPLLEQFLDRHPLLRVEIMVDDRLVDATAEGCDAGIRYGEHLARDSVAVPVGPRRQRLALAAAPDYFASRGLPVHPTALAEHHCIRLKYSSGALIPWEFERNGETVSVNPAGRLTIGVNGASGAIELAKRVRALSPSLKTGCSPALRRVNCCLCFRSGGPNLKVPGSTFPAALCQLLCALL